MKSGNSQTKSVSEVKAILFCILLWIIFLVLLFAGGMYIVKLFPSSSERFAYGFTATGAAFLATMALLKIERKSLAEIGLAWETKTVSRFFNGVLIGTVLMGLVFGAILVFTGIRLQWNPAGFTLHDALFYLSVFPLLFAEELIFRAYPFYKLNQNLPFIGTQVIVAIAFALYHIIIGWSIYAALLGPGIWAFVFGLAAWRSGGIAMPVGIHLALNVWQPILGLSAGTYKSLWLLKYSENAGSDVEKADWVGLIFQLLILITVVLMSINGNPRKVPNASSAR